jgi:hypothetical protein
MIAVVGASMRTLPDVPAAADTRKVTWARSLWILLFRNKISPNDSVQYR